MARQYGSPPTDPRQQAGPGYSDRRDPEPKAKAPDPDPPTDVVERFHSSAAVDTRREDMHHTLGTSPNQAASGAHTHRSDGLSIPLFDGLSLSGSKGGNVALTNLIALLAQYGLKDNTT